MLNRIRYVGVVVVLAGALAACGSSSSGGATSSGGAPPATGSGSTSGGMNVSIKNFAFDPPTLTVKAGTKVTFTNEDSTTHTATSQDGPSMFDSGDLKKGQSYTVTFSKAGTYHYICSIHQNMMGTVTVQ